MQRDDGLDRESAILYCGSEELLEEIIQDFHKLIESKAQKIEELKESGNIKDYIIEVHALKSSARMIGATELSERALELEMAGKEGNLDLIEAKTADLLSMYRGYKEKLAYSEENTVEETKSDASDGDISKKLDDMLSGIENFDIDAVDAAMKALKGMNMPSDELNNLIGQLDVFVTDVALDEIKDTINRMKSLL